MSSDTRVANGIPLMETPRMEAGSAPAFVLSSRMMSVIAAARNPIRFPYTPMERQPIFTSFGGAPLPTPRDRSHVTVSGERWSSSPISLSLSPFSLYSIAFFTRASMLFIRSPGARIGPPLLCLLTSTLQALDVRPVLQGAAGALSLDQVVPRDHGEDHAEEPPPHAPSLQGREPRRGLQEEIETPSRGVVSEMGSRGEPQSVRTDLLHCGLEPAERAFVEDREEIEIVRRAGVPVRRKGPRSVDKERDPVPPEAPHGGGEDVLGGPENAGAGDFIPEPG